MAVHRDHPRKWESLSEGWPRTSKSERSWGPTTSAEVTTSTTDNDDDRNEASSNRAQSNANAPNRDLEAKLLTVEVDLSNVVVEYLLDVEVPGIRKRLPALCPHSHGTLQRAARRYAASDVPCGAGTRSMTRRSCRRIACSTSRLPDGFEETGFRMSWG